MTGPLPAPSPATARSAAAARGISPPRTSAPRARVDDRPARSRWYAIDAEPHPPRPSARPAARPCSGRRTATTPDDRDRAGTFDVPTGLRARVRHIFVASKGDYYAIGRRPARASARAAQGVRPRQTGGCLCGAVRYRVAGPLRDVVACHCGQCRRSSGHHAAATAARRGDLGGGGAGGVVRVQPGRAPRLLPGLRLQPVLGRRRRAAGLDLRRHARPADRAAGCGGISSPPTAATTTTSRTGCRRRRATTRSSAHDLHRRHRRAGRGGQGHDRRGRWRRRSASPISTPVCSTARSGVQALDDGRGVIDPHWAAEVARRLTPEDLGRAGLRSARAGQAASKVAALPEVRAALLDFQQRFARREGGAVLDGRDIGTVICPEAEAKLFVTASDEVRAARRQRRARRGRVSPRCWRTCAPATPATPAATWRRWWRRRMRSCSTPRNCL